MKLIIVMVGLPARGKSYITKKLSNYLSWLNINNKIFNVGNKRRLNLSEVCTLQNADFFDPEHPANVAIRNQLALATLDDLLNYIKCDGNDVGIFDATNSTLKRREMIIQHIDSKMSTTDTEYNILFLESVCNDLDIIENNIKLKLNGPDYKGHDQTDALIDFKKRLANYESIYETVSSSECHDRDHISYIKVINIHHLQKFNINGVYPILVLNFLQNYNISKKKIWLSINNLDFSKISANVISESNLLIISEYEQQQQQQTTSSIIHKRIPKFSNLDQIHDLILDLENTSNDILIQTQDQFLINGLFKYFKILQYAEDHQSKIDLSQEIICINPDHYQVDLTKLEIASLLPSSDLLPLELSRSNNSSLSSMNSSIITPKWQELEQLENNEWKKFDLNNLNQELGERLEKFI